jgi:Domain of unknown function (DUF4272)
MTAQERKFKSERLLKNLSINFNPTLPFIEEEHLTVIRDAKDIAKRILILTYLNVLREEEKGEDDDVDMKEAIIGYLKSENLWTDVSKQEKELFLKEKLTDQDKINISWRSEAIFVMLWSIDKIEILGLPIEQCDVEKMLDLLPDFFESNDEFISSASIRSKSDIMDKSDLIYRVHWVTRQEEIDGLRDSTIFDSSMVHEWHYAINWITCYEDNWDDITTDT